MTRLDLGSLCPSPLLSKSNATFEDETEHLYFSNADQTTLFDDLANSSVVPTGATSLMDNMDAMELASANPMDITGQTLAETKMSSDWNMDLTSMLSTPKPDEDTTVENKDETQDLIDEMEEFMSQFEDNSQNGATAEDAAAKEEIDNLVNDILSMEQQQTLQTMQTDCPVGDFTEEESAAAEALLDSLLQDLPEQTNQPEQDMLQTAIDQSNLQDSGFFGTPDTSFNVSNVSEFQTPQGNVIIVVAPQKAPAVEESTSETESVDMSDPDWSPEPSTSFCRKRPGRKLEDRKVILPIEDGRVGKRTYRTVKDRKERKKLQNVEAARRYRDKKKLEQMKVDQEEEELTKKNTLLKTQLKEVESELKTMKKLMLELGLLRRVIRKWAIQSRRCGKLWSRRSRSICNIMYPFIYFSLSWNWVLLLVLWWTVMSCPDVFGPWDALP